MDSSTTAEFRGFSKSDFKNLIESSHFKKVESGGFLGMFKKVAYQDNFENYLSKNTELIGEIKGNGFLLFDDIVAFLKKYKSIDIRQTEYQNIDINPILEREENAYFLDDNYIKVVAEQLSKRSLEDNEIAEFNEKHSFGATMLELISDQKEQIRQLSTHLNHFKYEMLYIRCGGGF